MTVYTPEQIEMLTNHDGLLCKPPFRNEGEERQYYGRFLTLRLWRYLTENDWKRIAVIFERMKLPEKTKRVVKWLLERKFQ